jgi:hypothetical protein
MRGKPIVDERATPQQREALLRIFERTGYRTRRYIFQVFSATYFV